MADDPFDTRRSLYSPEGQARRWGRFARGLSRPSPRRHQAFMVLGCWALFSAMIVAILVVVYG
ncbi:hypothetical protein acdb102_29610 [Acidothermaceae bacterium B102]|nr:hypothetical protein acdb102_29610 [Acidothermaceae bacterium B102]